MKNVSSLLSRILIAVSLIAPGTHAFARFGDLTSGWKMYHSAPNVFELDLTELTAIQANPDIAPTETYSTTKSNIKNGVLQPKSWEASLSKVAGLKGNYIEPNLTYSFNSIAAGWVTTTPGFTFKILRPGFYLGFARGNFVYSVTQAGINQALAEGAEINIESPDFQLVAKAGAAPGGFKLRIVCRSDP